MYRLLLLLTVFPIVSFAQEKRYFDENWKETTKDKAAYYRVVKPENGLYDVKDYYLDGTIQFEGKSSSSDEPLLLKGRAIWYNENGKPLREANFRNNKPDGKITEYYVNGAKKSDSNYADGNLDGLHVIYFPSGAIRLSESYVNGKNDGKYMSYTTETQKDAEVNFKDGKIDGSYAIYSGKNGQIMDSGTAKNDAQEGECLNYFYDGGLYRRYTVKNGLLDGDYFEYGLKGEIITKGKFNNGKVISFDSKALQVTNGSQFSETLKLTNNIENWKIYRDGKLIAETFYKDGKRTGFWKFYTFDGKKLFKTQDYSNAQCEENEPAVEAVGGKFNAFFRMSDRFKLDSGMMRHHCDGVVEQAMAKKDTSVTNDDHPFYHFKKEIDDKPKNIPDSRLDVNYRDPADAAAFQKRNNVKNYGTEHSGISYCERIFGPTVYKIFLSENVNQLEALRDSIIPEDNEILFFYEKFGEKADPKSIDRNRYMAFKIPPVLKEALKEEISSPSVIAGILEADVFDVDTFSGSAAHSALEKEYVVKK